MQSASNDPAPGNLEPIFKERLQSFAGKGKRYDALLLLSGGKDSIYILNRCRLEFPELRLLCLTVHNGFMSPVAVDNAQLVAAKLGVDLLIDRSHWNSFAANLRAAFLDIGGSGASEVVDFADGSQTFDIGRQTARDFEIPIMLVGFSWVQMEHIAKVKNSFELPEDAPPSLICPLAAWRTDEQEIRQYCLDEELIKKGKDSPMVTNSELVMPMAAVDFLNLGYCSFEPEFAQLVREGRTDRKLWLNIFQQLEHGVHSGMLVKQANKILKKLNLDLDLIIEECRKKKDRENLAKKDLEA